MNLINIRNIEIEYFRNFFTQFGTQCALMIGLIAGSISQAPGLPNPSHSPYFFLVMYWVGSAGTVATAVHVLVCTVFISVFGQGLAIRGPLGSMITAIEGMIVEQRQVLFFYVVTVIFFAFQSVGLYWVMMDSISAIVSTVLTCIAAVFWYRHSLRIYNRFYWDKEHADWDDQYRSPDEVLEELYPHLDPDQRLAQAEEDQRKGTGGAARKTVLDKLLHTKTRPAFMDINTEGFGFGEKKKKGGKGEEEAGDHFEELPGGVGGGADLEQCGYMSLRVTSSAGLFGSRKHETWERRYFVVKGTLIFFYKDQPDYQAHPAKPINQRPIDLEGYTLIAGAMQAPYLISLVPADPDDVRKAWKFSCDTLGEFERWVGILTEALRRCRSEASRSEMIAAEGSDEVERLSAIGGGSAFGDAHYDYDDDDADDNIYAYAPSVSSAGAGAGAGAGAAGGEGGGGGKGEGSGKHGRSSGRGGMFGLGRGSGGAIGRSGRGGGHDGYTLYEEDEEEDTSYV